MGDETLKAKDSTFKLLNEKCKDIKVLYIEDDEKVRLQTSKMLSLFFQDITQVDNGEDGLNSFKNNCYDLIFTDINMKQMDGLTMIKHIRALNNKIPIVIFSAYDNTEYFLQAIDFDVDGYILKPFNFEEVQKVIEKVIQTIYLNKKTTPTIDLIDEFIWDIEKNILFKEDKEIKLTKNESVLFKLLSSAKNAVFTSQEIEIELFDDDYSDNKRVRSLISRLNTKLEVNIIESIYGQGYKLNRINPC